MKHQAVQFGMVVLIAAGALAFRLPRLGDRPMHADEAVQAARSRQLWQDGRYVYNPSEFHGPTLQWATLGRLWMSSADDFSQTDEATFRVVPVLFGTGAILLVWLLRDAVGSRAVVCAALLMAVSPAGVFYSRYYIHETLLTFFTLAAMGAGWRYSRTGRLAWCLAAGASIGLMQATKETAAIAYVATGIALATVIVGDRLARTRIDVDDTNADDTNVDDTNVDDTNVDDTNVDDTNVDDTNAGRPMIRTSHLILGAMTAVLVAAVLLSSFFTNPRGLIDGVLTYGHWLGRAGEESTHSQPWYYFLRLIVGPRVDGGPAWSEGLTVALAIVGAIVAVFPQRGLPPGANAVFVRWLAVYTIAMTAVYSAIPYKTPWCVLGMLLGTMLLAGVGAVVLWRLMPNRPLRIALAAGLLVAIGHLTWQSYRVSYVAAAESTNPYAYVPTMPDAVRLSQDVEQLVTAVPHDESPLVKVIWHDAYYWPLPWYLRRVASVGYWSEMPRDPSAPLVIATPEFDAALTGKLGATHLMTGYYAVRPNVQAQLWVRMDVWEIHLRRLGRL